jgi:2-methylcitrate dehydratase
VTIAQQLATFALSRGFSDLSHINRDLLKIRILDSLGCGLGALGQGPIPAVFRQLDEFGWGTGATLLGGGSAAPDRAAFFNTALVRYLDFMDNFLAKGESCHPSDNFGAVLAAADYVDASGEDFMSALAIAYQVQCRLVEEGPITPRGFDHTTQLAYSIAAGVGRLLSLTAEQIANALGMAGSVCNTLWVTRTGSVSQWKGLQSAAVALAAMHHTFLARHDIDGPRDIFEGEKGYLQTIAGHQFAIDWSGEGLDILPRTCVKRFNAEVHSQSAIEAVLELKQREDIDAAAIERIDVTIFDEAFEIIGGGEAGDRQGAIEQKEEADHSLPYVLAVALLDGDVWPEQYAPRRIRRDDVQALLRRVTVKPASLIPGVHLKMLDTYGWRYPDQMRCYINVLLTDGRSVDITKNDYFGFTSKPMTFDGAIQKFRKLSRLDSTTADRIVDIVDRLPRLTTRHLIEAVGDARTHQHAV